MPIYGSNLDIVSKCSWGHSLIVDSSNKPYKYNPVSDAALRVNNFLRLVLEITSQKNQSDRCRMLLQAACLARLGNDVLNKNRKHPFIVSAIYIDDQLCAAWYFVYQPNTSSAAVWLILQDASHYSCLDRLNM